MDAYEAGDSEFAHIHDEDEPPVDLQREVNPDEAMDAYETGDLEFAHDEDEPPVNVRREYIVEIASLPQLQQAKHVQLKVPERLVEPPTKKPRRLP